MGQIRDGVGISRRFRARHAVGGGFLAVSLWVSSTQPHSNRPDAEHGPIDCLAGVLLSPVCLAPWPRLGVVAFCRG